MAVFGSSPPCFGSLKRNNRNKDLDGSDGQITLATGDQP
jgi:hypothetical protein